MRPFIYYATILLVISGVLVYAAWPMPIDVQVFREEELIVAGSLRKFRLVVPGDLANPSPVVFAFHGMGDTTESMAKYSQLDRLASQKGFLLVYPKSKSSMWATTSEDIKNVDENRDIQFFDQLLEHISGRYTIDRNRIYAFGMSNGASFVQILAASRPRKLAAVVAHSGSTPAPLVSFDFSVPSLQLAGTNDTVHDTMRSNTSFFKDNNRDVEFVSVKGLGHSWSTHHNIAMWNFCIKHTCDSDR